MRGLLQAARAGDRQAVFELLSPATQQRLEDRARQATALVGASVRYRPLDLISIGSFDDAPSPSDLQVVEDTGERATVSVETNGGTERIEPGQGRRPLAHRPARLRQRSLIARAAAAHSLR